MINPFNITKAVDYTDSDIVRYWVDYGELGLKEFLKPTSTKPMLIMGSKGSGKTHMLKYFSYDLQKIRYSNQYEQILNVDKYLGIFMRCSGLNSERFKGKDISEERWVLIFGYYLDLWFAQKLLRILQDFSIDEQEQKIICKEVIHLFDKYEGDVPENFSELLSLFINLQKSLDYNVNNLGFIEKPKLEILVTLGGLIFGIPKIIEEKLEVFKGVNFLYIIDEFENITIEQQKVINSLYREKQLPVSFRISGRPYGYKTFETLGSGEENVVQSEYDPAMLDDFLRQDSDKYEEFIVKMSLKRLQQNGYNIETKEEFFKFFESFNMEDFFKRCKEKPEKYNRLHLKRLSESLKKIRLQSSEIKQIISNLSYPDNLLIEKAKLLLFYREWKKNTGELLGISKDIKVIGLEYNKTKGVKVDNKLKTVISYYKDDLLDQLARDSQELSPSYVGIENFIKLSSGIPRAFLNLMKNSFDNAHFETGKIPFKESVVCLKSQEKSIREASDWFFDENRIPFTSDSKYSSKIVLHELCTYLRKLRFSDLPPECSINLFSVDISLFSNDVQKVLKTLEEYSYLIKSGNRKTKNSKTKNETFFINGTIAAYYDLSINKRGVCDLSREIVEAILANDKEHILSDKIKTYNAPFLHNKSSKDQLTLL